MHKYPRRWPDDPRVKLTEAEIEAERIKFIPVISPERVTELLQRIRPLVRSKQGFLHFYQAPGERDPFRSSFTWDGDSGLGERAPIETYRLLEALPTYHTCGYHACFRPTIAEALAQMPEYLADSVVAFEVLFGQDLTDCVDYPGLYGHKTVTLFYGNAN